MPSSRSAFAATVVSGRLFAIGGNDGRSLSTVESLDLCSGVFLCIFVCLLCVSVCRCVSLCVSLSLSTVEALDLCSGVSLCDFCVSLCVALSLSCLSVYVSLGMFMCLFVCIRVRFAPSSTRTHVIY